MEPALKKLFSKEFIGLNVRILNKKISGKIIDETKNTFRIETKEGIKTIIKNKYDFEFKIDDKKINVKGDMLTIRPEERIKARCK